MAHVAKKYKAASEKIDRNKRYKLDEALSLVKKTAVRKFDESVDAAINLGVDPKHADQVVRGAVVLPNGTGKTKRVAVFAQGAKADEAKAAGADVVGMDDLAAQVKAGNLNFDVVIASPDTMRVGGTLGQILGPRGGQVVLVGYGRVGRRIGEALTEKGISFVVAEENREIVEKLRESGVPAVSGDASEPAVLIQAHVARARMLVIATPDTLDVRRMIEIATR